MKKTFIIVMDVLWNLFFAVLGLIFEINYLKSLGLTGDSKMVVFLPILIFVAWLIIILPIQFLISRYYSSKHAFKPRFLFVKQIIFLVSGFLFFALDLWMVILHKGSVDYMEHLRNILLYIAGFNVVYFVMLKIWASKLKV